MLREYENYQEELGVVED